ncbi:MAG: thiazole synthase, partial [Kiritimatiellae bacterium]|nr:thiazole synthase [Kiritimatiellia bacterium]
MKPLVIGNRTFTNRFFLGTGKFASRAEMRAALEASGTELVTAALSRVREGDAASDDILSAIDRSKVEVMLNTSGARTAGEAVRIAKIGKAAGFGWVKLEIHPDARYLLPDPVETLSAVEQCAKLGLVVLPYINADPVLAKRCEEAGAAAVMPLGAPIGSNRGLRTRDMLEIIVEQAAVPVVVDAGIGLPSHAAEAIELGADAVLANTAVAAAGDPPKMAEAFRLAVRA